MANKYTGRGRDESALQALRDSSRSHVEAIARGRAPGMNTAGAGLMTIGVLLVVVGAFWFAVALRQGAWTVYVGLGLVVAGVPFLIGGGRRSRERRRAEIELARRIEDEQRRSAG